jgi:hypothetical protein
MFMFFCTVATAAMFGSGIYPYISPAYGGGAASVAVVATKPGVVPVEIANALTHRVALIERDDQAVDLVGCIGATSSEATSIALPAESVESITLSGFVAMPDADRTLCDSVRP